MFSGLKISVSNISGSCHDQKYNLHLIDGFTIKSPAPTPEGLQAHLNTAGGVLGLGFGSV